MQKLTEGNKIMSQKIAQPLSSQLRTFARRYQGLSSSRSLKLQGAQRPWELG